MMSSRALLSFAFAAVLLACFTAGCYGIPTSSGAGMPHCDKRPQDPTLSKVMSRLPSSYLRSDDIPSEWDWRNANGSNFVGPVWNQMLPSPCGSCWAIATTSAFADRFSIASGPNATPRLISPQVLLDCPSSSGGSCDGGSHLEAYEFMSSNGITDTSCSPYMGADDWQWGELSCKQRLCKNCDRFGSCSFINATQTFYAAEYGSVSGPDAMAAEIYARGPIACSMYSHSDSFLNYKHGIIDDRGKYTDTTHVIVLVGYGVDPTTNMEYWIGRNSFGTGWGEDGFFKIRKGANTLNIEMHPCSWAVPQLVRS